RPGHGPARPVCRDLSHHQPKERGRATTNVVTEGDDLMENMVELRAVSKRFGDFAAVDNIDLHIRAGEFLTLLGPSGCGKTTMLRMISGFEIPTEGVV